MRLPIVFECGFVLPFCGFEIAETGLLHAEMELRADLDPDGDGSGTLSGSFAGGTYEVIAEPLGASTREFKLTAVGQLARRIDGMFQESLFALGMLASNHGPLESDCVEFFQRDSPGINRAVTGGARFIFAMLFQLRFQRQGGQFGKFLV